jgi:lysophospholipase L1-like esterase
MVYLLLNGKEEMLRKFFCLVISISLLWSTGCGPAPIKNLDSRGKNIICFGDSLTSGGGATPGKDYPSLLQKEVSLPVINAGVSGDITSDALKRLERDVFDKDPFVVIVLLGGNDFLGKIPKEKTFEDLDTMVVQIQEKGAIVVLCQMRAGFIMRDYAKGYRRIAKERGALLIPNLLGGILDNPNLRSDHIHPNDEGYRIMTQRILDAIQPLLLEKGERYEDWSDG